MNIMISNKDKMHFICRVSSKHSEFDSTVIIKEQEDIEIQSIENILLEEKYHSHL